MQLNVSAPIGAQLGYGITGLNLTLALAKQHDVSLFPIGQVDVPPNYIADLQLLIDRQVEFSHLAPCLKIWHQFALAEMVGRGKRVGMPIFELDSFNTRETHHLKSCDALVVCSEWAKGVIEGDGIDVPTYVAPLGVDTSIFSANGERATEKTIFFNVGKWEYRKGHDVLVECFCEAFKPTDDVLLWMFPNNPFLNKQQVAEWERLYTTCKQASKIKIFPRMQKQLDLNHWLQKAHCGVFPSRAEGWNLDALEALACGKHLIITDTTAHTEFCTKENSYLIDVPKKEDAYDGIWFHGQGRWAQFDDAAKEQTILAMRAIHQSRLEGNLTINKSGIETAKKFSWANTASQTTLALSN